MRDIQQDLAKPLEQVLGYLNFSAGAFDPSLHVSLNQVWPVTDCSETAWRAVESWLREHLNRLRSTSNSFEDVEQVEAVLDLVFRGVLPEYLEFHRDLLFHQSENLLLNSYFVGRACEVVLQQGPPWTDEPRIIAGALRQLNDYVGYRPVATLESRKIEPYPHEWLRPVPLFVRQAGVAEGPYHAVIQKTIELLEATDEDLLRAAHFDPQMLLELAIDPRAYDFDHPVNKRPNYHFGQWDPHCIDNRGYFRRFVIQQVTLDALMQRLNQSDDGPQEEILFEAAAVLCGTILMASGISGDRPETHDSNTSLSTLLPQIAAYRDEFYDRLLASLPEEHQVRLHEEALLRRQPFGAARQHLNAELARRRASQLEHVQLAKLYARMGYRDAATEQANIIPTASARILCKIDCRLTAVRQSLDEKNAVRAAELLPEVVELLERGIECSAIIDPWSILGFDAQFSLFPSLENSVHDHRADELVELMAELFACYARAWAIAAAKSEHNLGQRFADEFQELANWWRQFAAHEVSQVEAFDPLDAYQAAEHVAKVLNLWHQGGAASGDIAFWAQHAELFNSPQAYALVIEALFEQRDNVGTMGLLIHWLSESQRVPLEQGENSFHRLAERWMIEVTRPAEPDTIGLDPKRWQLLRKFFDYLEANAEQMWEVPVFQLGASGISPVAGDVQAETRTEDESEDAFDDDLYGAAYEDVVFRDSADDGVEGEIFDTGSAADDSLHYEAEALTDRLAFHATLARLWRIMALRPIVVDHDEAAEADAERRQTLERWAKQALENRAALTRLLEDVDAYPIPTPMGDHDSMVEYDRRRVAKESLLEHVLATAVEIIDASRLLAGAQGDGAQGDGAQRDGAQRDGAEGDGVENAESISDEDCEERSLTHVLAAVLEPNPKEVARRMADLSKLLQEKPLLYVPLAKGGNPCEIAAVRARQRYLQFLLKSLPRLGLLVETCRLIETARNMERKNPVGPGAVTEFDELYRTGFRALVHALCDSSEIWPEEPETEKSEPFSSPLVARLEQLTEILLVSWLAHSRTLRLSVMEKASDKRSWGRLVTFIEKYGADLFTQRFLNVGNIRAILHQGCDVWLQRLQEEHLDVELRLLEDLDKELAPEEAVKQLTLVLETVVENYSEYRDYNSTTTQSDRGEMLYTLLDFLRLRARYDRVAWNLKPVVIAHEILVRRNRKRAAQIWRRALRERIGEEADKFETRLKDLQRKYSMQMPSIADRISERFVRPMIIDRICSLIEPAMREATQPCPRPTFRILQYEIEFLTQEPSGVGFDIPAWLRAVEDEIRRLQLSPHEREDFDELEIAVPVHVMTEKEVKSQLNSWSPPP